MPKRKPSHTPLFLALIAATFISCVGLGILGTIVCDRFFPVHKPPTVPYKSTLCGPMEDEDGIHTFCGSKSIPHE